MFIHSTILFYLNLKRKLFRFSRDNWQQEKRNSNINTSNNNSMRLTFNDNIHIHILKKYQLGEKFKCREENCIKKKNMYSTYAVFTLSDTHTQYFIRFS